MHSQRRSKETDVVDMSHFTTELWWSWPGFTAGKFFTSRKIYVYSMAQYRLWNGKTYTCAVELHLNSWRWTNTVKTMTIFTVTVSRRLFSTLQERKPWSDDFHRRGNCQMLITWRVPLRNVPVGVTLVYLLFCVETSTLSLCFFFSPFLFTALWNPWLKMFLRRDNDTLMWGMTSFGFDGLLWNNSNWILSNLWHTFI